MNPTPAPAIAELDLLWLTAGLSCDGDTVSITAAAQPSIEDVLLGAIPGLPNVTLHNAVLAYRNGADFMDMFHRAASGLVGPFLLVVEGSIPNEKNKPEGYWAGFGLDALGQPIPTCDWIDRLAPKAWGVLAAGTCAAYGGVHAMEHNVTGCMGLPDYLGWGWRSKAGLPIVCVPGCPVQPDNFMETLLWLLQQAAGIGGTAGRDLPRFLPQTHKTCRGRWRVVFANDAPEFVVAFPAQITRIEWDGTHQQFIKQHAQ